MILHAINKKYFGLNYILILFFFLVDGQAYAQKSNKLTRVKVSKAQTLSEGNKIELPGNVLPWATSQLAAEVDGRVEKILIEEGQSVLEGAPLVYLRTQPKKLELELAMAEKEIIANQLDELTTGTRPEVIAEANAAVENAEATLKLAQIELNRTQKLFKDGVLSSNDFDNATTAADRAQAAHKGKKARWDELIAGPRIEKIKQYATAIHHE